MGPRSKTLTIREPQPPVKDEVLARKLQVQEHGLEESRRGSRGGKQQKAYIKIDENEFVDDYPAPGFYKKEDEEVDEYLLFEDDILTPADLPRRRLEDFSFYNADARLVPLELLPMLANVETDMEIFGSGRMLEDDGDADWIGEEAVVGSSGGAAGPSGESSFAGSSSSGSSEAPPLPGIRIFLSAAKEWMIEFGAGMLFITVRTNGAWYRLGKPAEQYAPWYQPVLKNARLAVRIITMLKEESRVSRLSFSDVIRRLANEAPTEATFISKKAAAVERYVVVHGQIILQQFREYPDRLVQQSSFIGGLNLKMEQRKHTKLLVSKKKLKLLKGRNANPTANSRPDATKRKPMRATTTKRVHRIWSNYYAGQEEKPASEVGEGEEVKEVAEEENEEQEEETVLAGKAAKRSAGASKRKAKSSETRWKGQAVGKTEKGAALYSKATANGLDFSVGDVVLVTPDEDDCLPGLVLVHYMAAGPKGEAVVHGRVLERGSDTVLGNAANERELFLTDRCLDVGLEDVQEVITVERRERRWGFQYRQANAAADQADAEQAAQRKEAGEPAGFFCRSLYCPAKGAFLDLPAKEDPTCQTTGSCSVCQANQIVRAQEARVISDDKLGFRWQGVSYAPNDFIYLFPVTFASEDSDAELEGRPVKNSSNIGLRPFAVCQIVKVTPLKGKPTLPGKLQVRRYFRPADVSVDKAYRSDLKEVYHSDVVINVDVEQLVGKCEVRRTSEVPDLAAYCDAEDTFICDYQYYPADKSVKQLKIPRLGPAIIRNPATSKGKGKAVEVASASAKGKGKLMEGETRSPRQTSAPAAGSLATLDIFAGCGGLSEGLHQSGVSHTKWAIEYEQPAAEAFKLNHQDAEVICDNCNVVLRAMMEKGGELEDCLSTPEADEQAAKYDAEKRAKLPIPGEVDFISGGPPCQGFSGMNRFNQRAWSKVQCEMILAYLSFADYLRPRYFLLENVRNLVSFNKGQTFRLTLASLIDMGYQVRFGVLQAGNYGVSQSRKRCFIWAAAPGEVLPEWPQPTHVFLSAQLKITLPGGIQYAAARDGREGAPLRSITVKDTIHDLPPVSNGAAKDEMPYGKEAESAFQRDIRGSETVLRDHISKEMNELNLMRCQRIPKEPGADWRTLEDVKVKLSSGQLVDLIPWCLPNTAERHNQWKGLFGRLDWNGNFPTSVTDPQPMGKVGMCFHPEQDRIVTVRECARSQGFPDSYRFSGNIQAKHRQIGNAVPPPLAKALGRKLKEALKLKEDRSC